MVVSASEQEIYRFSGALHFGNCGVTTLGELYFSMIELDRDNGIEPILLDLWNGIIAGEEIRLVCEYLELSGIITELTVQFPLLLD